MRKSLFVAMASAGLLVACGGGGGDSTATPASTTLSGVATKGLLMNAKVSAHAVDGNGTLAATPLKETTTDDKGNYTLDLGSYTGAVQLVVSVLPETRSKDEATGQNVVLPSDFKLHANTVVAASANGSSQIQNASITPFTELAHKIAEDSGGLTPANLASATKVVFDLIGVDPVATKPLDPTVAPPADATEDQKRYALYNAAVSKLATSAPTTTDPTTLACYTAAGTDAGKKIKCATEQIAKSVTVGNDKSVVSNTNLVGLGTALVAAASDTTINKTGRSISGDDAEAKHLADVEKDIVSGEIKPITVVTTEQATDIAKAKLFFKNLRANAASLQSAPLDTGLADGIQAFGDSVRTESLAVTNNTADLLRLAVMASDLWNNFAVDRTTTLADAPSIAGFNGGCTVYSDTFPVQFNGADGLPYSGQSTKATQASEAKWVGCSLNRGSQPTTQGVTQYRRTILFNMGAATFPGTVPYLAVSRKRFIDGTGTLVQQNLTPTLSGNFGYTLTNGAPSGVKMVGDLPPGFSTAGAILAARYVVNIDASLSQLASGAAKVAFTGGSFGVVPVGAATASLTLNLSSGGVTEVIAPVLTTDAAQVAAARVNIAASIKTAQGELTGALTGDSFTVDAFGDLQPGHAKFVGTIAAAGTGGTVATFLTGTLEGSNGAHPVVSFDGRLTLPGRPVVTLNLSVTEKTAATANTIQLVEVAGRYAQDLVTVQITGANAADGSKSLTLADSSGVSVSASSKADAANVLVSGRQTAVIAQRSGRINYADGTFESIN